MLCMQKRLGHIEKGQQDKRTTEDKSLDKDSNELNSLLPESTLHIAATPEDAVRDWPGIIQTFLTSIV